LHWLPLEWSLEKTPRPKGAAGTLRPESSRRASYRLKVNGSSLPHCSARPCVLSFSERACERWIASSIISGVAELRGLRAVVAEVVAVASVVAAAVAVASWADAEGAAMTTAAMAPMMVHLIGVYM
jgi:hypothetical protein